MSNRNALLICSSIALVLLLPFQGRAFAGKKANNHLLFSSKRCVALHQGQVCYLDVDVDWQVEKNGDYCLIEPERKKVLKCWENVMSGRFEFEFQGTKTTDFVLRVKNGEADVGKAQIQVVWVYSAPKRTKSNWRLF